jgi:hypothetical protein
MCNLHIGPHIRNKTCIHSFSGKIYWKATTLNTV